MVDVGIEYGVALFELSIENNVKHEVYSQLRSVRRAIKDNQEYLALLSSPAIPIEERYKLIDEAFDDKHELIRSFMKTLCQNEDMDEFLDATFHYKLLYHESENIQIAKVYTSVELPESEKERIHKLLIDKTGSKIKIKFKVDKSIIGGMIIDINRNVYDGSLRKKLNDIRKVITK